MMKPRGPVAFALCLIFAGVSALTKSSGCGKPLASGFKQGGTGSTNKVSFTTTSGVERTYLLHLPEVYTAGNAHGLIFSFHGRGKDGAEQERLSRFSRRSINPSMLVVYPDGIENMWQGDPDAKTDDVGFVLELIEDLTSQFCIDTEKIYAAGKSNGGGFAANVLACDPIASTQFSAFAGISGAYYQGNSESNCEGSTVSVQCNPGRRPIPIFETHGAADEVISYEGGPRRSRCLPSIPHFMTEWSERNGLGSSNVSTSLYDGNVRKYEYGQAGVNVHYRIRYLGHQW